jgi:hypothetical protein
VFSGLFASALWEYLLAYPVSQLFSTNPIIAKNRRRVAIFVGLLLWTWLALRLHPYAPNSEPVLYTLFYPFRAYFAPDVVKHVLIALLVCWLAYRAAAIYLDDIFELNNLRVAERFIRQSAIGSRFDTIEILNGDVATKDQNSPIVLIGGPGKVRVYLENAALFEKIGGAPHVIGPTTGPGGDGAETLEGFERLRKKVDLRDHVVTIQSPIQGHTQSGYPIKARTRDGLRVQVEGVKVIFSVDRDDLPATLETPYPFDPDALVKITYGFPRQPWKTIMEKRIWEEFKDFISGHTLSEFLAAIGPPEASQLATAESAISEMASLMAGVDEASAVLPRAVPPFVARPEIRELFFEPDVTITAGVELRWIGLGTWVLPGEIIPEHHLEAWRMASENLRRVRQTELEAVFRDSRVEQLRALVANTPWKVFAELNIQDPALREYNMARLITAYRVKLDSALQNYQREGMADVDGVGQIQIILNYLTRFSMNVV